MSRGETKIIRLERSGYPPPSWGFRLQGGSNFDTPLSIQSVQPGSVSEQYGLQPGDAVIRINNLPTDTLAHDDAKAEIVRSGDAVEMMVTRGAVQVWKPKVTPMSQMRPQEMNINQYGEPADDYLVQRTSLAADKMEAVHIGSAHNRSAAPFPGGGSPRPGSSPRPVSGGMGSPATQRQREVVHNPYNSPMGLYSGDNAGQAYQQQTHGVGSDGVNVQHYGGFQPQQQQQQQPQQQQGYQPQQQGYQPQQQSQPSYQPQTQSHPGMGGGFRSVTAPSKPAGWTPPEQHQSIPNCWKCGNSIIKSRGLRSSGVFMRVRGQPLHPDCLKCCKCGVNLKNVGYCIHEDDFYCEPHYKQSVPRPENVLHLSGKVVYQ